MPEKIITQEEIQSIFEMNAAFKERVLALRRRVEAGEKLEPGPLDAELVPDESIEHYESSKISGIIQFGLSVAKLASYEKESRDLARTLDDEIQQLSSDWDRALVATCARLLCAGGGSNTPFEEFLENLLYSASRGTNPTPEDVAHELDTFRQNWEDMQRDAAQFLTAYPPPAEPEAAPEPEATPKAAKPRKRTRKAA